MTLLTGAFMRPKGPPLIICQREQEKSSHDILMGYLSCKRNTDLIMENDLALGSLCSKRNHFLITPQLILVIHLVEVYVPVFT